MTNITSATGLVSLLLCSTAPALAQTVTPAGSEAAGTKGGATEMSESGATAQTPELEEIVVTAQKRSENLQNVPIAIAAVTAESLIRNQVVTTQNLQFSVPGLVFTNAATNAQPYLRGIGSVTTGPNFDASVATYVDGVFVSNTGATLFGLLGIDRVEVLKGPQGTLYGRNAVGGAINFYTLTPTQKTDARINLTYGNFNRTYAAAHASGGTDTLAVGLYAAYNHRDTFYKKIGPTPGTNEETEAGIRLKAVWTPSEAVTLTGSAEYMYSKSFEKAAIRNIQPDAIGYTLGAPRIIKDRVITADMPMFSRTRAYNLALREEIDLGWSRILGITGYRDNDIKSFSDIDGTILPLLGSGVESYPSKQFSQEVQLLSPDDSAVRWIAGVYYFREKALYDPVLTLTGAGFFGPGIAALASEIDIRIRSYAAFAQATIPITDQLSLTAGGRYTIDKKRFEGHAYALDTVGDIIGGVTDFPIRRKTWRKFTPRLTVEYDAGRTLVYATWSKGFKSGAFNWATPAEPGPVNPETLTAFEVGTKNQFGRLRLNTAAYYYKHKDIQEQQLGATSLVSVQNAAEGELYGAELEVTAAVTSELTLNGSATYQQTEYKSFPSAFSFIPGPLGNAPAAFNAKGNTMPRAPKWTTSLSADYRRELINGAAIDASVKWFYNDGFFWEPTNRLRQDSYHLINASIGYTLPGGNLILTGFVSNLTNAKYDNGQLFSPISILTIDGEPRMYGASLRWKL